MMTEIRTRQTGDTVSVTLPKEMLDRLNVGAGDRLFAIETERGVLLTATDPTFDEAMRAFESVRQQYRNTLRKLAE